jgi:hypothetical protein
LQEFQDLNRSEGSYLWYKKHCWEQCTNNVIGRGK